MKKYRIRKLTPRECGRLMEKIAQIYEEQVEDGLDHLISIVEPTLVALLCVVIGAILLSVMLPMAGVLSAM